jgi:hypothetical protein
MHASTRSAALRAAAKVTLSASILGCGGATATEDAGPLTHAGDAASHVVVQQVEAASAGPCPGVTTNPDASVSQSTFECCMTALSAELYDGGSWRGSLDASTPTAKDCCASVIGFVDHGGWQQLTDVDSSTVAASREGIAESCCAAVATEAGVPVGPACTPWGPPVPPSMEVA